MEVEDEGGDGVEDAEPLLWLDIWEREVAHSSRTLPRVRD